MERTTRYKPAIADTFDRVVVINLARRFDRMAGFRDRLVDWPFQQPQRFDAVDGNSIASPPAWDKGSGAWGCLLSHRRILDQAIKDGVQSVMVLEDDAHPVDGFTARATEFLGKVPDDWDGLMFGAEHLMKPLEIYPGVLRCTIANRAHAYAVRGRFMRTLCQFWHDNTVDHCDIVMASLMPHFRVYAPDPALIGQHDGLSDISNKVEPLRFWFPPHPQPQPSVSPAGSNSEVSRAS